MLKEIVFVEGNNVRRLKGEITEESNFFIVRTLTKTYKINKMFVIKIEEEFKD